MSISLYASVSGAKASSHIINATKYVVSLKGLKDVGAASLLGMGLTTVHELGYAIAGKMLYGFPFDITLGATASSCRSPLCTIGPFKLGGLNPATAYAVLLSRASAQITPDKEIIIYLAGPLFGAVSSAVAYLFLKRYAPNYHIAKYVSVYGIFHHIIGPAGLLGLAIPGSDAQYIWENIQKKRGLLK